MNENKNKYKINNIVFIIIGITSIFLLIINFITFITNLIFFVNVILIQHLT